jgi:hypothetical protein
VPGATDSTFPGSGVGADHATADELAGAAPADAGRSNADVPAAAMTVRREKVM